MATTKTTKVLPVRQPLKREPTHPGEILREDVLPALRMNVSQAARELGVSRQLLHRILAGRAPVTPEMAVRLGKWAGNGLDLIRLRGQVSCVDRVGPFYRLRV